MSGGNSANNFSYTGTDYSRIPVSGEYSTLDFPPQFSPTPKPDGNFHYDYDYDEQKLSSPLHDIQNIRLVIKAQKPGSISALADYWVKAAQLLDAVQKTVSDNANALHGGDKNGFGGWTSPAANEFLRWGPGATLYSLKQWTDAANANVRALRKLSEAVSQAHTDIDVAWQSYVDEAKADKASLLKGWAYDPSTLPLDQQKKLPGPAADLMSQIYEHQTAIWRKWSVKAQGIAYELSQKYYAQLEGDLAEGRGTRFEGPSNAVVDNPMTAAMPGPPGGSPGAAPPPGASARAPGPKAPPPRHGPAPKAPPSKAPPAKTPPTSLHQLAELAHQVPAPSAPPPSVGPDSPQPLPLAPPNSLLLSPSTAALLGLAPPPAAAPRGLFANSPGLTPAAGSVRGLLSRQGVLRAGAAPTANESTSPPALGRAGLGRPGMARLARSGDPESMGGRRPGARGMTPEDTARPGAPATGEQELFGRGSTGATAPVLGGRRTTGVPRTATGEQAPTRAGAGRPGTTPPVVKGSTSRRDQARPVSHSPADEAFGGQPVQPGATSPILGSPAARLRGPAPAEPLDAIPRGLRGARITGRTAPAQSGPSELSTRRRAHPDRTRIDELRPATEADATPVIGDEAWAVDTPGGPVLTGHTEQSGYVAQHRPTLGGGSS